jgi:EAL domain-containing protein (putative c-di-GMP-specific phosphodiesterase class I)
MRVPGRQQRSTVVPPAAPSTVELLHAVRHDLLHVAHQPVVGLGDRRVQGSETLVRWLHPRLGMLLPARFMPLAHLVGATAAIDLHVLRATCRRLAADPALPGASTNVSRDSLLRRGFVTDVLRVLAEHEVPGHRVMLELSEELTLADLTVVAGELRRLRQAGVQVVLDDLGSGATTLDHVRVLRPAWVKVDRSLVTGVESSLPRLRAVERIVDLARSTGAGVTAEGIEAEPQAVVLAGVGCQRGQGWLFGRPVLQLATDRIGPHGDDQRPQERPRAQHRRESLVGGGVPARQAG